MVYTIGFGMRSSPDVLTVISPRQYLPRSPPGQAMDNASLAGRHFGKFVKATN